MTIFENKIGLEMNPMSVDCQYKLTLKENTTIGDLMIAICESKPKEKTALMIFDSQGYYSVYVYDEKINDFVKDSDHYGVIDDSNDKVIQNCVYSVTYNPVEGWYTDYSVSI